MNFTVQDIENCVSKMILSASGWRCVFAKSQNEQDFTTQISSEHSAVCKLIAYTFSAWLLDYCHKTENKNVPVVAFATDTRPTGSAIAKEMIPVLSQCGLKINYVGVACAPEIMAYAKKFDAFIYISASHNPVGHNGIKFGLNDGGVIDGEKSKDLISRFRQNCKNQKLIDLVCNSNFAPNTVQVSKIFDEKTVAENKGDSVFAYLEFCRSVICASDDKNVQNEIFTSLQKSLIKNPISIAADLNGSARTLSIDSEIFRQNQIHFYTINDEPFKIAHEIIPEPENLVHVANFMEALHKSGDDFVKLGYMPDCDGDRGNIVYWDENSASAKILKAQEVFSLSVLAELCYMDYLGQKFPEYKAQKIAVSVNDPTSMRIEEIARVFGAQVFRAEVGEANVVNLARKLRSQGYQVRILGEGSNGGTITHPACVRDPINTIFALLKLLSLKDEVFPNGKICYGLFHRWCVLSCQEKKYKADFSLSDIVKTLPAYTTTGVSEKRAVLHVKTSDHAKLKSFYQTEFLSAWEKSKKDFFNKNGIFSWKAFCNKGTEQFDDIQEFSLSERGGLKIIFYDNMNFPVAFIWMRGSGTEPVFRVMCDVKGVNPQFENALLAWHTKLIQAADNQASSTDAADNQANGN